MKNNCLTHLLKLWNEGHRFQINYNGNHCYGVNKSKIFELGSEFKEDLIRGFSKRGANTYIAIELCQNKETISKIFNLNKEQDEILEDYYKSRVTLEQILE